MKLVLVQMFMAFMACLFFAIVYNTPKKDLIYCGIFGGLGYGLFYFLSHFYGFGSMANFFGAALIAVMARIVSKKRQMPIMVYVLPSVYPLAPGGNMYRAAYAIIKSDMYNAADQAMICIKVVGLCVIAIILVLSLPESIFKVFDSD